MKLLIATTNRGKLGEIMPLLEGLPVELVTLADEPRWTAIAPPEETGRTFAENARLKARHYAGATGLPTVAEDSGLEIDALDGAPGVESARWGGATSSYAEKFALIYEALGARKVTHSTAWFRCAVALVLPHLSEVVFETTGMMEGRIAHKASGSGGFGYDPIFYYPPFGCTLADAGHRKSSVSHRSRAFRSLRAYLESELGSAALRACGK